MTPFEKAERAKQLLNDELLNEVLEAMRMRIVGKLEDVGLGDKDTPQALAITLQLLKQIRLDLMKLVNDQIIEDHNKKQDEFIRKTRKRAGASARQ